MDYPHKIKIYRAAGVGIDPTPATQDPDTGRTTDVNLLDDDTTIWEGRCDVQDKGEVIQRDQAGQPTLESDATCFLAKERAVSIVNINDRVTVTWEDGSTQNAVVLQKRRLDGALLLRRLYA